jgi:hypothetical protein
MGLAAHPTVPRFVTGPARSVADNGKVLTTKIQGCLINGAARGDLSSEKVYVKLQRMTCAQPGGRYAVSEVKGFIAFAGKSGVRGRVVSREGSLITQAFLASLAGLAAVSVALPAVVGLATGIGMAAASNRKGIIQKHPHPCHNPRTAPPVISAFGWCTAHGIGAIKYIKKAAPTGIGGIQRVARIGDRHDKLRPRHQGNLWVCICGINLKIFPFGQQIADLLQKRLVGFMVMRPGAMRDMPGVNPRLQVVAPRQKRSVLGAKIMDQRRQTRPEGFGRNPSARKRPVFDEAG